MESEVKVMQLDAWLQNTLAEIAHRFPEIGFFLMAANTEPGRIEFSVASNIERALLVDWLTQFTAEPQDSVKLQQSRAN
jgi:hypothetical protein